MAGFLTLPSEMSFTGYEPELALRTSKLLHSRNAG